jgi:hypothetical protein
MTKAKTVIKLEALKYNLDGLIESEEFYHYPPLVKMRDTLIHIMEDLKV